VRSQHSDEMCNAKLVDCDVIQVCDLPVGECAFGVMGCGWWERRVYWQIVDKMLAGRVNVAPRRDSRDYFPGLE